MKFRLSRKILFAGALCLAAIPASQTAAQRVTLDELEEHAARANRR